MIDLNAVVQTLLGLASAAVLAAIPILVPALLKRLHIANNAVLTSQISDACASGAGAAYSYALQHTGGFANVDVHSEALAHGINYVTKDFGPKMAEAGVTPERVAEVVTAKLGALMANDPSIGGGQPASLS